MYLSIIIPTHNRADSLKTAMDSIVALKNEAEFEFVIVDNNSKDNTKQVVELFSNARYVFESRTSFTRARKTGGENAKGDILLYLDDDIILLPGSLKKIIEVFTNYQDCGVIAGKIMPHFTAPPPNWVLECQKEFNGWSLFDLETHKNLSSNFQDVVSAAGPMMAIRRSVYDKVGGFPPDTIGVETNSGPKSFNKLYIGPGDYGLCYNARLAGYKIYYSSEIAVYHVIPPVRFTVKFWRSRLIGEGYHEAISQRGFFHLSPIKAYYKCICFKIKYHLAVQKLITRLDSQVKQETDSILPEELMVDYYTAYLDMDWVLRKYPRLWEFLWEIGNEGVSNANYNTVIDRLPSEYIKLVSNEIVYDSTIFNNAVEFDRWIAYRSYYAKRLHLFFNSDLFKWLFPWVLKFRRKVIDSLQ